MNLDKLWRDLGWVEAGQTKEINVLTLAMTDNFTLDNLTEFESRLFSGLSLKLNLDTIGH